MSGDRTEDQAVYLEEIIHAVCDELYDRLDAELDEKDTLAVVTAVGKAAWRGLMRGVATMTYEGQEFCDRLLEQLRDQLPANIELPYKIRFDTLLAGPEGDIGPEPDAWRKKYGEAS